MLPVTIATPQSGAGLTLFPLIAPEPAIADYDLLPDALEAGTLVITEVSEQGTVPELLAINSGPRDVLILDGMQLIGAKQNRTVSRTILLAAGTKTRIPVSCMEQGRWRAASRSMSTGLDHSPARVRRRTRTVEARQAAEPSSLDRAPAEMLSMAQGEVWSSIRESGSNLGAYSETGALDHLYTAARPRLDELESSFPAVEGQVGFVAFLGGAPVGADVLESPAAYARLHDRLVRGYLFEALEAGVPEDGPADGGSERPADSAGRGASDGVTADGVRRFLDEITHAERRPLPTVGRGHYHALAGVHVGGELALEGRVVHLSAFPG